MRSVYYLLLIAYYFLPFSAFAQENSLSKKDTADVRFLNQRKFFIYKVDKNESLFSISKKFNISQIEIIEFNSELKNDGLKPKMKIWIPAYSLEKKKGEKHVVVPKEEHHADETYSVALLLALNIPKNFSLDLSLVDSNFIMDVLDKETINNLEFYEGALLAIDSLKEKKLKVRLHVYDTENDSLKTAELLKKPEMKQMDIIISNCSLNVIKLINEFSKTNHLSFSSCSMNAGELLGDNRDAIAMLPASLTQCKEMGKFVAEKFRHDNCIILKTAMGKENERSFAFRRGWLDVSEDKLKEVDYSKYSKELNKVLKAVKDSMSTKLNNLIFVPSSNEDFVTGLVNGLKEYSEEYKITLLGLPTWQYFETIDPILFELHNVNIFTSSFINYNNSITLGYRKKFYSLYNIEPTDGAFEGYDMMMILGSELMQHGRKFIGHLTEKPFTGLYSSYKFERTSENSFTENHYISVCRFQNYELKKINE